MTSIKSNAPFLCRVKDNICCLLVDKEEGVFCFSIELEIALARYHITPSPKLRLVEF